MVRAGFGNNNVDTCARVCHSPTGYGLKTTIGTSTSDNGGTSTKHILSANAGLVSYDMIVNSRTYDLVQVDTCYQVTFYKFKSLTDSTPDTDMYHRIEAITRIETADPAACP